MSVFLVSFSDVCSSNPSLNSLKLVRRGLSIQTTYYYKDILHSFIFVLCTISGFQVGDRALALRFGRAPTRCYSSCQPKPVQHFPFQMETMILQVGCKAWFTSNQQQLINPSRISRMFTTEHYQVHREVPTEVFLYPNVYSNSIELPLAWKSLYNSYLLVI